MKMFHLRYYNIVLVITRLVLAEGSQTMST